MMYRIKNFLISADQFLYSIVTLGGGNPDETCSSAAWRAECDKKFFGFFRTIIDIIFFWEPNHCYESYIEETNKREFIKEYYSNKK